MTYDGKTHALPIHNVDVLQFPPILPITQPYTHSEQFMKQPITNLLTSTFAGMAQN